MKQQFGSVIEKRGAWCIAYVPGLPGVNTQGRTRAEARHNLKEALALIIASNREIFLRQCVRSTK
jgi:predicted RNase H-like HicB family nuclease